MEHRGRMNLSFQLFKPKTEESSLTSHFLLFFTSTPSAIIAVGSTFKTRPEFNLYHHYPGPSHHYLFPWWRKTDSCLIVSLFPLKQFILNPAAQSLTGIRLCHLFAQNSPIAPVSHRVKAKDQPLPQALCDLASCLLSVLISYLSPLWHYQPCLSRAFALAVSSARMLFSHTASSLSLHPFQVFAHTTDNTPAPPSLACSSCFVFICNMDHHLPYYLFTYLLVYCLTLQHVFQEGKDFV